MTRRRRSSSRLRAALGSALFLVIAPGATAGLIPWLITGWDSNDPPLVLEVAGIALIVVALPVLLAAFWRFAVEGLGTPAPVAPTEHLVVGGLYRWVRNPMYVAVASLIAGQALLLGRLDLVPWLVVFWVAVASFVRFYEEPTLAETYGAEYEAYRAAVPAWIPRLTPWSPS